MSYYAKRAIINGLTAVALLVLMLCMHGCSAYYSPNDTADDMIHACLNNGGIPTTATVVVDTVTVMCEKRHALTLSFKGQ